MYSGNSSVVNFLMRFPALIPVAVAIPVVTAVAPPPPAPPPPPPPVVVVAPPPAPLPKLVQPAKPRVLPPVEALCPPPAELTKAKLAKLSKTERAALKSKGCIKG
jgi:hypothetical protein